jgi:ABC-type multidrug transport system fused ATPase/permease subunit
MVCGAYSGAAPARHSSKTHPRQATTLTASTRTGGQLVMKYPIDPFMPAVELAAAIRRKEVSPVEVAECYLDRIDELDPRLNAFCHRADDDVRKAASAAADAVVRAASAEDLPPFHGVPLPVKDLLEVAGWPTTHGSAGASKAPAEASDPIVQHCSARHVDTGAATESPAADGRGDAVRLVSVRKVYDGASNGVVALAEVTTGFQQGSFTAVMGPSGSGKTTLLLAARGWSGRRRVRSPSRAGS